MSYRIKGIAEEGKSMRAAEWERERERKEWQKQWREKESEKEKNNKKRDREREISVHQDILMIDSSEISIGNEQKHHLQESSHNHKDRVKKKTKLEIEWDIEKVRKRLRGWVSDKENER